MTSTSHITFGVICFIAMVMAIMVKGFMFSGILMGTMLAIALWALVIKFPSWLQRLMGKHVLIADLLLSAGGASVLAAIGPGPTVFMALVTQMVLLSILLQTLKIQ